MNPSRVNRAGLDVAAELAEFIETDALSGTGFDAEQFWAGLAQLFDDLVPTNRGLLDRRDELQRRIDQYHRDRPGAPEPVHYTAFLESIGYLLPEPAEVEVTTTDVDREIAALAGPQLVVPLLNARFAVNAANARWGSLYDALYGTDAIGVGDRTGPYDPVRGAAVIRYGRELLDRVAALSSGTHADARKYSIADGTLTVRLADGTQSRLIAPSRFVGWRGDPADPDAILLVHHGLHLEIVIDRAGSIGRDDAAHVQDLLLESALTTIMDLEDSVAAVDAEDKTLGYRNWRELMRGTLRAEVTKGTTRFVRTLAPDREYLAPDGSTVTLPGRSVMFVRTVGHSMMTDVVRDRAGEPVPEGMLDTVVTALGSLCDLRGSTGGGNSRTGSVYLVKPKMHGPDEVAFTVELFACVEALLQLPPRTLKLGIMDEERRTSLNLKACIAAASDRVVFINTGFLDRTGSEINTSFRAGPMVPKREMRDQPYLDAYERANVDAGLRAGLAGRGQIGKGMWAMPDLMKDMLDQKVGHVRSGASTAWVPSPTAATLHAVHYHDVDVARVRAELAERSSTDRASLLIPPLAAGALDSETVSLELDDNLQSILGYVTRWVDQGVGCSKVPDLRGVALMEDRATLRISSQLLANWLEHGVITIEHLDDSLRRLAPIVDRQNAADPHSRPVFAGDGPDLAVEAARRLVIEGAAQPSGYTEPILHELRRRRKAATAARPS